MYEAAYTERAQRNNGVLEPMKVSVAYCCYGDDLEGCDQLLLSVAVLPCQLYSNGIDERHFPHLKLRRYK